LTVCWGEKTVGSSTPTRQAIQTLSLRHVIAVGRA